MMSNARHRKQRLPEPTLSMEEERPRMISMSHRANFLEREGIRQRTLTATNLFCPKLLPFPWAGSKSLELGSKRRAICFVMGSWNGGETVLCERPRL